MVLEKIEDTEIYTVIKQVEYMICFDWGKELKIWDIEWESQNTDMLPFIFFQKKEESTPPPKKIKERK